MKSVKDKTKEQLIEELARTYQRIAGLEALDIRRKRVEEALRESEEKLRRIFESVTDGITVADLTGNIVELNQATMRLHGYDNREELIGQGAFELIAERDYPRAMENMQKTLSEGYVKDIEYTFVRRDGSEFDAELSAAVLTDDSGNPVGFVAVTKDITERKWVAEALRRSEEKYKALFEQKLDGVCVIDENMKLLLANQAAADMFGFDSVEELLKVNLFDHVFPEERERILKIITKDMFENDLQQVSEFRCRKKSGEEIWVSAVGAVIEYQGKAAGLASFTDITDRKRVEEESKKSREELRNLSTYLQSVREEERKLVAYEIHDELGQALTALKMDLSWLVRRLPEEQKPLLEKAEAMSSLIDTTSRTVKRISSQLRPGLLDDLGLIAAIEWQAEEFQSHTGIKCQVNLEADDTALEQNCATAIFRIFQEALTNVARHAGATKVKVSLAEKAGKLVMRVRDNGTGIAEEQISAPQSFGLMVMRERARYLGGEFKVSGTQGKGTTLILSIPLDKDGKSND